MFSMQEAAKNVPFGDKHLCSVLLPIYRATSELSEDVSDDLMMSLGAEDSGGPHTHCSEGFRTHRAQMGFSSPHFFFLRRPDVTVCYHLVKE